MSRLNFKKLSILTATVLVLLSGCTTERDGLMYRSYHNLTARYNGYFYAKESMREADGMLLESHEEDWDKILPVFIYGTEETSQEVYPQMERVIEKTQNVIDRHTMNPPKRASKDMKKPEMNKWIDNNWLLMGQAYFYKRNYFKAEEIFRYVTRKFKDPEIQVEAFTWLARVYIEKEQWIKANNQLVKAAQQKKDVDEAIKANTYLVYADYHLRQEQLKDAAEKLEKALVRIEKKKDKARPTFILAQIKQELSKSQEAIENYERVVKLKPEYEMEFYAKINQALAYSRRGGNPADIKETLLKMLKDDKNLEYQDQIYYALADLAFDERDRDQGIELLNKSLEVNTDNVKQRGKTYLRLADVHFEEREYEAAQEYYSQAVANMSEDHDRYKEVANLAESLTDLVYNLDIINEEDSLLAFCDLSEADLERELKRTRRKIERQMEEKREADEAAAAAAASTGPSDGAQSMFWAYNDQLRSSGYLYFKDYWGDRPLEDNWRRRNKLSSSSFEEEEPEEGEETGEPVIEEENLASNDPYYVPSLDELREGLPCGDDNRMDASQAKVTEAYYQAGVVYKEKLEDFDNAVEMWEVLVTAYDDSEFHPTTFYQLYRAYLAKELEGNFFCPDASCSSKYWAERISEKYPGSEWDKLVTNPDYKDYKEVKEAEERAAYELLYEDYHFRQYIPVIEKCSDVILNEPDNHLLCKYRVLKARCIGHMDGLTGQRDNYIAELNSVIQECPETEEAEAAEVILKALNQETSSVEEEEEVPEEEQIYSYDEAAKHYLAVVFPVKEGNVNDIKSNVSDFNSKYFKSDALKTTSNLLGKEKQIVMVKTFTTVEAAQNYYSAFINNDDELGDVNGSSFDIFIISKENYLTLFKTKSLDAYTQFFATNYEM